MQTVISAVQKICNLEQINYTVTGMRPGEKVHEDMLAETELPFTYEVDDKLMVVLPQYTNKSHTHKQKYEGVRFNSSLHLSRDVATLTQLISRGLEQ